MPQNKFKLALRTLSGNNGRKIKALPYLFTCLGTLSNIFAYRLRSSAKTVPLSTHSTLTCLITSLKIIL